MIQNLKAPKRGGCLNRGYLFMSGQAAMAIVFFLLTAAYCSAADLIANGTYVIKNKNSNQALDVYQGSTTEGARVDQWDANGGNNQLWQLTNLGNNYVELISVNSNMALDVYNNDVSTSALIDQWPYSGGTNQRWQLVNKGGGYYELINENSGLALDVPMSSTTQGTDLDQWTINGNANQLWSFTSSSGGGNGRGGSGGTTLSGDLGSHDPSRMTLCNGRYYVYSTGGDIPMKSSPDRIHWTEGPVVFPHGLPAWTKTVVPGSDGTTVWAPDVLYFNGEYHLYYAVPASKNQAIGLVTSPTLDPGASNYKWSDQGPVFASANSENYSAIDPAPVFDAGGNLWLSLGSGYVYKYNTPTILVIQLNSSTGQRISSNSAIHFLADGHIEGSYIFYRNGYYYLFYNSGGCCSGTSSTYEIHISRSRSIFGPYEDKNGNQNSSSIFLSSSTGIYGPGQIGILEQNGTYYFTYHYYNPSSNPVLGEGYLSFDSQGWPLPNPL